MTCAEEVLTPEQCDAIAKVIERLEKFPIVLLDGSAGTGKTTCMKAVCAQIDGFVLAATTHRAALRLTEKTGIPAVTMHAAVMKPQLAEPYRTLIRWADKGDYSDPPHIVKVHWDTDWEDVEDSAHLLRVLGVNPMDHVDRWIPKAYQPGKTLVLDEASMLSAEDVAVAQKVYGRILLVGDPKQLRPVNGKPVIHNVPDECTARLTTIHRQSDGSPVLDIAYSASDTGVINAEKRPYTLQNARSGVPLICWTNRTRIKRTDQIRALLGLPPLTVMVGEPLVCRAASKKDRNRGLVKNSMWVVAAFVGKKAIIRDDAGNELAVKLAMEEFAEERGVSFRFGYALTCHTAQGSEWPVVAIDAGDAAALAKYKPKDAKYWAYTAVTRASKDVFLAGGVDA